MKIGVLEYDWEEDSWILTEKIHPFATKVKFPFKKSYYDPTKEGAKVLVEFCQDDSNWYIISVES